MSYTGKNPTFNWLTLTPQSSDPTSPNEGDVFRSDGTSRAAGIWEYRSASWQQVGSSANNANYIDSLSAYFESTAGLWATYADAAGSSPVDGTGGAPSSTFSRTTSGSEILRGTGSGKFSKDAANRQGEGVSVLVSVDKALRGKPATLKFSYNTTANFVSGSSSSNSDVMVFIYDVTNSTLLGMAPNWLDGSGFFSCGAQIPSTCASLRVILHVATTSALAYDLIIDEVELTSTVPSFIPLDSDWQSYTPTFTGFGTPTNVSFRARKDGPDTLVEGTFTCGTTTATEARVTFPYTSASTIATLEEAGTYAISSTTLGGMSTILIEASKNYFTFGYGNSSSTASLSKTNGNTFTSGQTISLIARIPTQGFTTGFVTAGVVGQNVPAVLRAFKNAGSVTANTTIPTWTTVSTDKVGGFDSSTGIYTVKYPGSYRASFKVSTTTGTPIPSIRKNGSIVDTGLASSSKGVVQAILNDLVVGDQITFAIDSSLTVSSTNVDTTIELEKIETPQASLNVRKVAVIVDSKASGTDGGTFTSGSYQTRTLNTIQSDPFGLISLSSNQITFNFSGRYLIEGKATATLCGRHKAAFYNTTTTTYDILAVTCNVNGTITATNTSHFKRVIDVVAGHVYELRHRCQTTRATDGFGPAASFGDAEIYAEVSIEKL